MKERFWTTEDYPKSLHDALADFSDKTAFDAIEWAFGEETAVFLHYDTRKKAFLVLAIGPGKLKKDKNGFSVCFEKSAPLQQCLADFIGDCFDDRVVLKRLRKVLADAIDRIDGHLKNADT